MAYWGIAYCLSSSYNWPPGLGCGYDTIQRAVALSGKVTPLEADLINALAERSSLEAKQAVDPTKMNFGNEPELNKAFAEAMTGVYAKYADNDDVAVVYVEALMNLNPWKLWSKNSESGEITAAD